MEPPQLSELAQLAELPERNPGPVGRLARDAKIQMANAAARTFLGREDIVGECWAWGFYNPRRRHSTLNYLSPADYELQHAAGRHSETAA